MAPPKSSQYGSAAADDASSSSNSLAPKSAFASKSASPAAHASSHKQPASSSSFVLPRMSDPTPPASTNPSKRSLSPAVAHTSVKRPSRDSIGNPDARNAKSAAAVDDSSANSTHYGTRSRNRTGGARPNYAEDRDIDTDMLVDSTASSRRDDEPKKASSRSAAPSTATITSNSWSISSLLERDSLRPTKDSANSALERERDRSRKPLPGNGADASASASNSATSANHSSTSASATAKTSSHAHHKDKDANSHATTANASASSSNGNNHSSSSSSNSRKRKAASSSSDKAATNGHGNTNGSTNGHGNGSSQNASSSLLNISLKKNGAAAAAAAAAAASSSGANGSGKGSLQKGYGNTNLMTFEKYGSKPNKDGKLVADDGSMLSVNDHVYLVCEPPGEPYYLARVMEFMHPKNNTALPVDALRVNWYYRPRDIGRKTQDTRCIFATMHSDITPLTALRGICTVKHKAEIQQLDQYRREKDAFWFEKLYDRYIQKNYEVIPTIQIVNVPERVKRVLHERWRFVLVEQGRGKDLTAAAKQCKRCSGFCASNNSVDCAVCSKTYHMSCVRPPLLKKPSRGFAWSCAACSRAQERLLEARHTPNVIDGRVQDPTAVATTEDEFMDEDDDECPGDNPDQFEDPHPEATAEQQYQASLWPYRYLGIHAKVEDALDYDDRIYPRAATRVGPRHQANIIPWAGRPVEYVNPPDIKKATRREARLNKEAIAAYEKERDARPKWVQETPAGYVHRGEDYDESDERCTAFLVYKSPTAPAREPPQHEPTESAFAIAAASAKKKKAGGAAAAAASSSKMDLDPPEKKKADAKEAKISDITDKEIDTYMAKAVSRATKLGVPKESTNLHDVAADLLFHNNFNTAKALKQLDTKKFADFKEPQLNAAEQKRFEEAVTKFGSELNLVTRHVKTVFYGNIVRWYYAWKKSERGKIIWGNNASRKGKKEAKEAKKAEAAAANKIQDDVADDIDDSAFDTDKAVTLKRQFLCKFCNTKSSRQWRRAPAAVQMGVLAESLGGGNQRSSQRDRNQTQASQQFVAALCRRCAELWRRYAVQWEDVDALTAKVASLGGRLVKRKMDEELMKEIAAADEMISLTESDFASHASSEPPRKKHKGQNGAAAAAATAANSDKDSKLDADHNASDSAASTPASTSSSRRKDRAEKADKAAAEKAAAAAAANADKTTDKTMDKTTDKTDKAEKAAAKAAANGSAAAAAAAASSAASTPVAVAPPAPELPRLRELPCAVCYQMELPTGDQRVTCRDCRLTVHRSCYGVLDNRSHVKWQCDMCANDRHPHKSIDYRCVLCPVDSTPHNLAPEPVRPTHKKKTDKDRERERTERELSQKAIEQYRQRQEELNKPVDPREALKRTADNNWVHVTCAVWTSEVKFGKAKALEPSEGIPSVPRLRYGEMCKVCKGSDGACVPCHQCRGLFHVECAHQAGHIFGFDLVPIKGSRRDQTNMVTINGDSGLLTAAIWCQEHVPLKGSVHLMHEAVDDTGMTVFQLFVETYKQADRALTGCARKANLLTAASKVAVNGSANGSANGDQPLASAVPLSGSTRRSSLFLNGDFADRRPSSPPETLEKLGGNRVCFTCGCDVSPKWHAIGQDQERELANGHYGKLGSEAQKFVDQRQYQCHQCKKLGRQPSPHVAREPLPELHQHQHQPYPPHQHQPHQHSSMHNGYAHHTQAHPSHQSHHQYPYGSIVKTEEDTIAGALQRVAPHYAQDSRGPSLPPQARTPGAPPLSSLVQSVSQSPLAPPPMARQVSQPVLGQPPLHHQAAPPQGPAHTQHAHSQHSQHAQPPRSQPSHHHIMHHEPARTEPLRRPSFSHSHSHHTPVQTHAQTMSGSPQEHPNHYWSPGAGAPPPMAHQGMRPSSGGSPTGGPPHSMHGSSHGMPHHSPHSIPATSSRTAVGPPPMPVHSYHNGPSSSSNYSNWHRSGGGPPPQQQPQPQRREPLHHSGSSSSMPSPVTVTQNLLRPPPLGNMQNGSSNSSGSNSSGGYMSHSMMSNRPPSPPRRSMASSGGNGGGSSSNGYNGYGSPHVQHSSPGHHFSQILHPPRSSAAPNYGSVTREDFTLRGPSSQPPARPSDARNPSSASSNASLRNLLS